jgi:hypothetical protein
LVGREDARRKTNCKPVKAMVAETGASITWWAVASAFGGTIIGAALGGAISYWLQRQSLAASKALHDADRREVRKALGYGLFFKMIRLTSDLAQIGMPVDEAVKKAAGEGRTDELWPGVLPILPLPDPIKFSPDEMALVLSLDNSLFNDMAALDDLHKNTVAIFSLYAERRVALTDTLRPETMAGNLGSTLLTRAERDRMRPRSVELDMLIHGMLERTRQNGNIAWDCLKRLHAVLKKEFDLKNELKLKQDYEQFYQADAATPAEGQPYYHHYKS